jgi:hypothetical protein
MPDSRSTTNGRSTRGWIPRVGRVTNFGRKEDAGDAEDGAFVSKSFAAIDRGACDAKSGIAAEEMSTRRWKS